jgi:uncharacterized Zn-finger protein
MASRPSLSNLLHSSPHPPENLTGPPTADLRLSAASVPAAFASLSSGAASAPSHFPNASQASPISPIAPPPPTAHANASSNPKQAQTTPTQRSHANTASLYQCADCQRRYSRPEHLARHIQTHTLGKRFACQVCGKAFARADLLKRHAANHENDNDASKKRRRTNTEPGAGRVSHACRSCATARVKCEEVKPCTRCRSRNLNCEYASSEPGSVAAMHLLHLSANAHSSAAHSVASSSPKLPHENSSPSSYNPSQPHPPSQRVSQSQSDSPVLTQSGSIKPEEAQLPTPDTVMEQGMSHVSSPVSHVSSIYVDLFSVLPMFQSLLNAAHLHVSHHDRGHATFLLLFMFYPIVGAVCTCTCREEPCRVYHDITVAHEPCRDGGTYAALQILV